MEKVLPSALLAGARFCMSTMRFLQRVKIAVSGCRMSNNLCHANKLVQDVSHVARVELCFQFYYASSLAVSRI